MDDLLKRLEETHGLRSLGACAVHVYAGALEAAGGDATIALQATISVLAGIFSARPDVADE